MLEERKSSDTKKGIASTSAAERNLQVNTEQDLKLSGTQDQTSSARMPAVAYRV